MVELDLHLRLKTKSSSAKKPHLMDQELDNTRTSVMTVKRIPSNIQQGRRDSGSLRVPTFHQEDKMQPLLFQKTQMIPSLLSHNSNQFVNNLNNWLQGLAQPLNKSDFNQLLSQSVPKKKIVTPLSTPMIQPILTLPTTKMELNSPPRLQVFLMDPLFLHALDVRD